MSLITIFSSILLLMTGTESTPCRDKILYCDRYGKEVCKKYNEWAKNNCESYCEMCDFTSDLPTTPSVCQDRLENCESFGEGACTGIFQPWAMENCPLYCGLCSGQNLSTTTSHPNSCRDRFQNCDEYGKDACAGVFKPWAMENCAQFCGLCDDFQYVQLKLGK